MTEIIFCIWENIWKIVIVIALIYGIIYILYEPLNLWTNPPEVKLEEINLGYVKFNIPPEWEEYSYDSNSSRIYTYSDLTNSSFINGMVDVYKFDNLGIREDQISLEGCISEQDQLTKFIYDDDFYSLLSIKTTYNEENNSCDSVLKVNDLECEDCAEIQYHRIVSFQNKKDIIMFVLSAPYYERDKVIGSIEKSIKIIDLE